MVVNTFAGFGPLSNGAIIRVPCAVPSTAAFLEA